jgi:hypothetical protein
VKDVARVPGRVRVASKSVGALPVAVRREQVLVLVRVIVDELIVSPFLNEEPWTLVVVRVALLDRVVASPREVHAPRLVIEVVELKYPLELQPLEVDPVRLHVHPHLPAVVLARVRHA